jgi:hypothetical protein
MPVKRVGLKYCGGCNPSYDRVAYVRAIQEAAGTGVEWAPIGEGGFATILLVSGCDKQCVEMAEYETRGHRVVRIKDNHRAPEAVLDILLEEGEEL